LAKVTVREIAKLAKVSIGTVDRALNDRPGVKKETKKKILQIARKYDYRPNRISKALARRHKDKINIGVITLPQQSPFAKQINEGIREISRELDDYGVSVIVQSMKNFDIGVLTKKIAEFVASQVDGIAMIGIDNPVIRKTIDDIVESGIAVVTYNSDIENSKRLCFVGQDLYRSGQVAADLLGRFMGSKGNVLILHGSEEVTAHKERVAGFLSVIKKEFPSIKVTALEQCQDNENLAYRITMKVLKKHPEINGIYIVARAAHGAAKAVLEMDRAQKMKLVCNDLDIMKKRFIKQGIIDAIILQDPATQGSLPIRILFNLLFDDIRPEKERYYTKMDILTKHMVS
jgi:LacI family transcriptional regulator